MEMLPNRAHNLEAPAASAANYDRELINQILDEGFICQVGLSLTTNRS